MLEDKGYEAFDKLLRSLIPILIERAAAEPRECTVLFIDGDDERLERRYMEGRGSHPLAGDHLMDGIRLERQSGFCPAQPR